ncbi:MAG: hypothetical protein ACRENH_05005 [Gemmatimonadaceae bacterium]
MKHFIAKRLVALLVLLVHSSVYGAAAVLDEIAAARATAQVAHVESDSGPECAGHDEAACGLCQVRMATGTRAPAPLAVASTIRHRQPNSDAPSVQAWFAHTALHSRAPPTA